MKTANIYVDPKYRLQKYTIPMPKTLREQRQLFIHPRYAYATEGPSYFGTSYTLNGTYGYITKNLL